MDVRCSLVVQFSRYIQAQLDVGMMMFQAFLSNLTAGSVYDLTVAAFVESTAHPGILYESPQSTPRRVFVGRQCDPHQVGLFS